MVKRLYPGGKPKAFNITYDDGVLQDVRFVQLLNRYGLKGTFNLNSQLMRQEFEWMHETGMVVKRLPAETAAVLYAGHEVASHSLTHPYMHDMDKEEIMHQLGSDKENLERLLGRSVSGFAVPFSYYSRLIADCARECGFEYSRCSDECYSYAPPEDYYRWTAGAFHLNGRWREFARNFFARNDELALLQIVGHSYDLDAENMWEEMEDLFRKAAAADDILPVTNIELVRYLKAVRSVNISGREIHNTSAIPLWFEINGRIVCINPGKSAAVY